MLAKIGVLPAFCYLIRKNDARVLVHCWRCPQNFQLLLGRTLATFFWWWVLALAGSGVGGLELQIRRNWINHDEFQDKQQGQPRLPDLLVEDYGRLDLIAGIELISSKGLSKWSSRESIKWTRAISNWITACPCCHCWTWTYISIIKCSKPSASRCMLGYWKQFLYLAYWNSLFFVQ